MTLTAWAAAPLLAAPGGRVGTATGWRRVRFRDQVHCLRVWVCSPLAQRPGMPSPHHTPHTRLFGPLFAARLAGVTLALPLCFHAGRRRRRHSTVRLNLSRRCGTANADTTRPGWCRQRNVAQLLRAAAEDDAAAGRLLVLRARSGGELGLKGWRYAGRGENTITIPLLNPNPTQQLWRFTDLGRSITLDGWGQTKTGWRSVSVDMWLPGAREHPASDRTRHRVRSLVTHIAWDQTSGVLLLCAELFGNTCL